MKYETLLAAISKLTPEQLRMDVTIFDDENDEFYPIISFDISDDSKGNIEPANGVLDNGHPYLTF